MWKSSFEVILFGMFIYTRYSRELWQMEKQRLVLPLKLGVLPPFKLRIVWIFNWSQTVILKRGPRALLVLPLNWFYRDSKIICDKKK